MTIKAIGFDFDGTLISSEDRKGLEMAKVFREKFNVKRGVQQAYEQLIGKGRNREEKVKLIFQQFLQRKPTKKEIKLIDQHFGYHYEQSLNTCPLLQCTNQ